MSPRYVIVIGLVAAALLLGRPQATPAPQPAGGLDLTACFEGPDAAADAATVAAMADEIASVIEWDGEQEQPLMTTGFAIDKMRTTTREMLCRGERLGPKHPRVCERVCLFLDGEVGNDGGPLSEQKRADWVAAYREIARAARATIR